MKKAINEISQSIGNWLIVLGVLYMMYASCVFYELYIRPILSFAVHNFVWIVVAGIIYSLLCGGSKPAKLTETVEEELN